MKFNLSPIPCDEPGLRSVGPDPVDARDVRLAILRSTVSALHEARRRRDEIERACEAMDAAGDGVHHGSDDSREMERWSNLATQGVIGAESNLIRTILVAFGRICPTRDIASMDPDWAPCCFEVDKVFYVVGQNPDQDQCSPILTIVDSANDYMSDWS